MRDEIAVRFNNQYQAITINRIIYLFEQEGGTWHTLKFALKFAYFLKNRTNFIWKMENVDSLLPKTKRNRWGPVVDSAQDSDKSMPSVVDPSDVAPVQEEQTKVRSKKQKIVFRTLSSCDLNRLQDDSLKKNNPEMGPTGEKDSKGYYRCKIAEVISDKYTVMSTLGQGVFATVFRCLQKDVTTPGDDDVAIKVRHFVVIRFS